MKRSASDAAGDSGQPGKRSKTTRHKRTAAPDSSELQSTFQSSDFTDVDDEFLRESGLECKLFTQEELPGADVIYIPSCVDEDTANNWYTELKSLDTWYQPTLKVYGKSVIQSRSIAAYATDPMVEVKYSGQKIDMHYPYPPILEEIQRTIVQLLGMNHRDEKAMDAPKVGFNHVMLNQYEDGSVYIGRHSDTKHNKVIASLSLGAERTFIMTPRKDGSGKVMKWKLKNGSLLVMQGDTQVKWKHEIPKEPSVKMGRISLTFRQVMSDPE